MSTPYTPPVFRSKAFHCPSCGAYANQQWFTVYFSSSGLAQVPDLEASRCTHCGEYILWRGGNIIFPDASPAPLPNGDLPEDIKDDYLEARDIINKSPRGAAALLRLCVQKLCKHLGESGKDINQDIASLVKKGLNPKIQKSLDIVRVVGNDAVHPGQIDLKDKPDTAVLLCQLINIIAEAMLTQPKLIDQLYGGLPEGKREHIAKRDNKTGI
jgi:hypothetical protein